MRHWQSVVCVAAAPHSSYAHSNHGKINTSEVWQECLPTGSKDHIVKNIEMVGLNLRGLIHANFTTNSGFTSLLNLFLSPFKVLLKFPLLTEETSLLPSLLHSWVWLLFLGNESQAPAVYYIKCISFNLFGICSYFISLLLCCVKGNKSNNSNCSECFTILSNFTHSLLLVPSQMKKHHSFHSLWKFGFIEGGRSSLFLLFMC